jgi:replication factor A1
MTTDAIKTSTDAVMKRLKDSDVDVPKKDVTKFLQEHVINFSIPPRDAEGLALRHFLKKAGKKPVYNGQGKEASDGTIASITGPGQWLNLKARVVQLWESKSSSIAQVGLLGDETGIIKFVSWASVELPPLDEDKSYYFKNVVSDEYEGKFGIKFVKNTTIEPLDADIVTSQATFRGLLVDIQKGSGLIKRCPVCNRTLQRGICQTDGKVIGLPDLRIKGVLDNGSETRNILVQRELTEKLTGMTLEAAGALVMENLDNDVVASKFKDQLIGHYYIATGTQIGDNFLVASLDPVPPIEKSELERMCEHGV